MQAGGGEVVGSAHLGSGATHVVCQPEAAVKWLAMGTAADQVWTIAAAIL